MGLNIAVCLSGQVRTGVYCAPYIKDMYTVIDKNINIDRIDYFCCVKDYHTVPNLVDARDQYNTLIEKTSIDKIDELLSYYNPILYQIITYEYEIDEYNKFVNGDIWLDAILTTIRGWIISVKLKNEYELTTGIKYDVCFCQRFDVIIDPRNGILDYVIREIYSSNLLIKNRVVFSKWVSWFNSGARLYGIDDFMFGGDSFSIDLIISSLSRYLLDRKRVLVDFNEKIKVSSINAMIYNCIIDNDILLKLLQNINSTIVRPDANLTLDVLTSYNEHNRHWKEKDPISAKSKKSYWEDRLTKDSTNSSRLNIANDPLCHIEILEMFINHDIEKSVVQAAAKNTICSMKLKMIANDRLSRMKIK